MQVIDNDVSPRQVRITAAQLGIDVTGKKVYELIREISAHNASLDPLRKECARRGLSTDGNKQDLELRLEQASSTAVLSGHRKLYYVAAIACLVLGIAGLLILLPHTAAELRLVMGLETTLFGIPIFAVLFAIIIDCGIATTKAIDTLAAKFEFGPVVRGVVWTLMLLCLGFSCSLNASQFLRHVEPTLLGQTLAVGGAIFVACFVFCSFYIGSTMLLRCEDKRERAGKPADLLRQAAADLDRLEAASKKVAA